MSINESWNYTFHLISDLDTLMILKTCVTEFFDTINYNRTETTRGKYQNQVFILLQFPLQSLTFTTG